ncbi:glutathione S-transferase family protein [Pararhizobium sp. IMCC21322]|uniref:glutathione S-transferase family protein n=1 Tax=Pararhizobium sp. IMCC21322 TaxID=3067903 RepID=UPI00274264CD|nr:glutathione S-transferase family protein [Pararhizobium sp. IMCC21322]
MMILRTSPSSPFGRQIQVAADILQLSDRIRVVDVDLNDPHDTVRQQNPLGKIPVLINEDGMAIYDSRVILEYLDFIAGGAKLVPQGEAKFPALTLHALANGITDAAVTNVYETRFRPAEQQSAERMTYQAHKIARGLKTLEAAPPVLNTVDDIQLGHVALACALSYLDLRFEGKWREPHPALVAWLDSFEALVPAFEATKVTN